MSMLIFLQLFTALLWLSSLALLWLLVLSVLEVNDGRVMALLIFAVLALILTGIVVTAPYRDECPPLEKQSLILEVPHTASAAPPDESALS